MTNTITGRDRKQRVTSETIDGKEYRYSYDTADRLVRAQYGTTEFSTPEHDWQYCYNDPAGTNSAAPSCQAGDVNATGKNSNRTASYDGTTKTAGYTYDTADRLTSVTLLAPYTGQTISYDSHGNTTNIAGEQVAYDGVERHLSTTKGTDSVTYQRDALDRIVSRTAVTGGGGGGAIAFRSSSTATTSSTSIVINKPAGTATGDVMIAVIARYSVLGTVPPFVRAVSRQVAAQAKGATGTTDQIGPGAATWSRGDVAERAPLGSSQWTVAVLRGATHATGAPGSPEEALSVILIAISCLHALLA